MQSGMDDMIHKPFTRDELYQLISRYLSNDESVDSVSIHAAAPAKNPESLGDSAGAVQVLDKRLCEELQSTFEPKALDALLATFLTRLNERIVRLNAYWQSENRQALCQEAHSLKGAAASLGCSAIAEQASQLEQTALAAPMEELGIYVERLTVLQASTKQALQRANMLSF
tara:strand:- start:1509 stop:2021 length:513 start_codon:yes stop_codon:yes gene_type:complete